MCPFPSRLFHQSRHRCFGWCSFDLGQSCKMYSHLSRILCKSIQSLDNKYNSSQTVLSPLRRASNQLLKVLMCSHVIQSSHCSGCLERRLFLCSSTYGVTKVEFCRTV